MAPRDPERTCVSRPAMSVAAMCLSFELRIDRGPLAFRDGGLQPAQPRLRGNTTTTAEIQGLGIPLWTFLGRASSALAAADANSTLYATRLLNPKPTFHFGHGDWLFALRFHLTQDACAFLRVQAILKLFKTNQVFDGHECRYGLAPALEHEPLALVGHTVDDVGEVISNGGCLDPSHAPNVRHVRKGRWCQ